MYGLLTFRQKRSLPGEQRVGMRNADSCMLKSGSYLDVTAPAVEVKVQVLNLAVFGELVRYVLLSRLLVHIGHEHYPPLDGCGREFTCQLLP